MTVERPDVPALLSPLKGFQRTTVDYAFHRLFEAPDTTNRFLVADEVGLGKTLVARGIIARTIDHLWDDVDRIDVVYICSNNSIARQNIQKLAVVGDAKELALTTRLTLLPKELQGLQQNKVNFVSFTPGTSFDLKSRAGKWEERVVLYWLLHDVVGYSSGLRNLLQGWRDADRWWNDVSNANRPSLEASLQEAFAKAFGRDEELREDLAGALEMFKRLRRNLPDEHRNVQNAIIGRLRTLLAKTCVDALEPDLVILDEFQRFKDLLDGTDAMADLARHLWTQVTPEGNDVRVLLLSATPYRMYSTDGEVGEDDHYPDFIRTTRFLMGDDDERVAAFEGKLRAYRQGIYAALHGDTGPIEQARDAVQEELRRVMCRTERVAATEDRGAMVREPPCPAPVAASDLKQFVATDAIARAVGDRDPMELWKSAPYLPNFMQGYKLKELLEDKAKDPDVVSVVREHRPALLYRRTFQKYRKLDPANARLRALMRDLLDGGQHELLWVPPSLPYWELGEPFASHRDFTKALVFSSWNVVPDVISTALSYEAERRMLGDAVPETYMRLYKEQRGRLRFTVSDDRPTGMPALALQYPCLTVADEVHPLSLGDLDAVRARVEELAASLPEGEGPTDERWYWAAPVLLDARRHPPLEFLGGWTHSDDDEETRFDDHVQQLVLVAKGELSLGRRPEDLAEVLTELALAGPGVVAARTFTPLGVDRLTRRRAAAVVAEGLRSLFNQPTSMALLRRLYPDVPYWRSTLRYSIAGNLQALFDEFYHQLWEQEAWSRLSPEELAMTIAGSMAEATTLKVSRVTTDILSTASGHVNIHKFRIRTSYALRYGRVLGDKDTVIAREGAVRAAFNSPFRPFVLASTSIGQEGLDFHPWCHVIYHWNLPGNPVDLEQREGRVHRYKGHAVRKNVARAHGGPDVLAAGEDVWARLFRAASNGGGGSELVPYWLYEGETMVERRVPSLSYSRELERLPRLRRDLVAYRVVFGQPRQEELLSVIHEFCLRQHPTVDLRPTHPIRP